MFFYIMFYLLLFTVLAMSQKKSKYEIADWQGFRKCAVSYTFDDNTPNQIDVMVPIFDKYNYKMTLFTVTNWDTNWKGLLEAVKNGHEIASHTVTHPNLGQLNKAQQIEEFKVSKEAIEKAIGVNKCNTIAYPFCVESNIDSCQAYYIAARTCSGEIVPKNPEDFMMLSSFLCGTESSIQKCKDFIDIGDSAAKKNGWAVYLMHAVDNEEGYSPVSSKELEGSIKHFKENDGTYWVASFGSVAKYIIERNDAKIVELKSESNFISLKLKSNLDSMIFNEPLTIKRRLPKEWNNVNVKQNDVILPSNIIVNKSKRYIIFDSIPNNGNIEIINNQE